ncbi:MAG: hypothetical protein ACLSTO_01865 [Bilophila wadsworthia]
MKKNILILSTSPRKNGNSEMLAREFARGAEEADITWNCSACTTKPSAFAKAVWPARKRSDASSMTMPTPSSEK